MDLNTIECSENAQFSENSDAIGRRFSLPSLSSVQPSQRFIELSNLKRIVFLTFERFKKMAYLNNVRRKGDYEDLDINLGSSIETISNPRRVNFLCAHPNFCQSDSAIYINSGKYSASQVHERQKIKNNLSGSIPYLFRQNVELSQCPEKSCEQKTESFKNCLMRKENICLLSFLFFYILYLLLGSYLILLIEQPIEDGLRKNFTHLKERIFMKYMFRSEDEFDELKELEQFFLSAHYLGISVEETELNKTHWTFGQSLFFSTTLVTTVGYGHMTPRSDLGKTFCIIFSGIGIPLTLTLMTGLVGRLLCLSNYLLKVLVEKFNYTRKYFTIRLIHLFVIGSLVFILFFAIPVCIFHFVEDKWTILDAFYFCFISLTTIGLGDLIPDVCDGCDLNLLYMTMISIYLITGLIAMMLLMTVFYEIPQLNIGNLFLSNVDRDKDKEQSKATSLETTKD